MNAGKEQKSGTVKQDPKETAQEAVHQVLPKEGLTIPGVDQIKGIWKQQMGAAKVTWGKLTDDELLQTKGHVQKLVGLVQERYAITRDDATAQINRFFEKHSS